MANWITTKTFDVSKISFTPGKIMTKGSAYKRFDTKYIKDESTTTFSLTTGTKDTFLNTFGIRDEINYFNKPKPSKQITLIIDDQDADHCELYNILEIIGNNFAAYYKNKHNKELPIKFPMKIHDGGAHIYASLIESNNGTIFTKIYNKDGANVSVDELERRFVCRPLIIVNFVVKDTITMKVQLSEIYVAEILPEISRLSMID